MNTLQTVQIDNKPFYVVPLNNGTVNVHFSHRIEAPHHIAYVYEVGNAEDCEVVISYAIEPELSEDEQPFDRKISVYSHILDLQSMSGAIQASIRLHTAIHDLSRFRA